jgi:methyl-accepting chemotaxis protein
MATNTEASAGSGLRGRYTNRLVGALAGAGVAILAFAAVAYVLVVAPIEDPALRRSVLSGFVGLVLTAFVSLALVGVTVGSNTAITLRLLSEKATRMEQGDMDVELATEREDEFGQLAGSLASMRDSLGRRIEEVEQERRSTERLNEHMRAKAEHYDDVLGDVTDGDLSRRVDPDSENESLAAIGESINATVAELESATENIAGQMQNLSANSEEVAAAADELADTSERAAETGATGRESAREAIEAMSDVEAEASDAVEEIERLRAEMEEIESAVGDITEVARRTNILAVNARIESSRSDGAEQGYSVVADEIRDLAERAQEASQDIERRIEDLRAQTEETAMDITETEAEAEAAAETVRDAMDALDRLVEYVEDVDANAQNIDRATDDQAESVQSVAAMVDKLAAIRDRERESIEEHGFERVRQD